VGKVTAYEGMSGKEYEIATVMEISPEGFDLDFIVQKRDALAGGGKGGVEAEGSQREAPSFQSFEDFLANQPGGADDGGVILHRIHAAGVI
jgi:hypothetical protein